jgi:hypothetical protein
MNAWVTFLSHSYSQNYPQFLWIVGYTFETKFHEN